MCEAVWIDCALACLYFQLPAVAVRKPCLHVKRQKNEEGKLS